MSLPFSISFNPMATLDKLTGYSEKKRRKRENEIANRNYSWAKEFAQNSMQWKADDLRKAGINPIYAMGAGGYSAPVSSADTSPTTGPLMDFRFTKEQKSLAQAQANKIQSEANKNNAEARHIDKSVPVANAGNFNGFSRLIPNQDLTEAMENDMGAWLSWHGTNTLPTMTGAGYDERYSNLWNELVHSKRLNPLKHGLVMDNFGNFEIVSRNSPRLKRNENSRNFTKTMLKGFIKGFGL